MPIKSIPHLHPMTTSRASDTSLEHTSEPLSPERVSRAKAAFTTRRVPVSQWRTLLGGERQPRPGDLVLARVTRKRQHTRVELANGRKSLLYVGDEVVLAYGNRYASDQFEATVPANLAPCHMVASGGVAAAMLSRSRDVRPATEIEPLGLIGDERGDVLNLRDFALGAPASSSRRPFTVAVVGSAMNAGKTTTAAQIIHGLSRRGVRVGAAKVTGTGSGGDVWKMADAGAIEVVDFTDAGHVSTYRVRPHRVARVAKRLHAHLVSSGADAIVLEIADGLFQQETAALLESDTMAEIVDGYMLAVTDSLSAAAGAQWLQARNLPLLAICGTVTRSPLASREAVAATGLPVLGLSQLVESAFLGHLTTNASSGFAGSADRKVS